MYTRVVVGRARVVREIRAAGALVAALRAPVPARGPWLTAVLNHGAAAPGSFRPVAVVVETHAQGPPEAVAYLELRRRGPVTLVTLLGSGALPRPDGRPPTRLPARTPAIAALLAEALTGFLHSLRWPWSMHLSGLPLGDPTVRELAARLPTAAVGNERSRRLVDGLDEVGGVVRTRDPAVLERWLPALLAAEPDRRARPFLRAAARVHAAIGQLELAVVAHGSGLDAALLTLVDGPEHDADRWPWWGTTEVGGLCTELGSPSVALTVPAGPRLR